MLKIFALTINRLLFPVCSIFGSVLFYFHKINHSFGSLFHNFRSGMNKFSTEGK